MDYAKERVKLELEILEKNLTGLATFMNNNPDEFNKLPEIQQELLQVQLQTMHTYKLILVARLDHWENNNK